MRAKVRPASMAIEAPPLYHRSPNPQKRRRRPKQAKSRARRRARWLLRGSNRQGCSPGRWSVCWSIRGVCWSKGRRGDQRLPTTWQGEPPERANMSRHIRQPIEIVRCFWGSRLVLTPVRHPGRPAAAIRTQGRPCRCRRRRGRCFVTPGSRLFALRDTAGMTEGGHERCGASSPAGCRSGGGCGWPRRGCRPGRWRGRRLRGPRSCGPAG